MSVGPISSVSAFAAPPVQRAESTEAPVPVENAGEAEGSSTLAETSASEGGPSGSGQVDVKA